MIRFTSKPIYLGSIRFTRGALEACSGPWLLECLSRHERGDWGNIPVEDARMNDGAVHTGGSIRSAYPIDPTKPSRGFGDNTLWIYTEAGRRATTVLLPSEH